MTGAYIAKFKLTLKTYSLNTGFLYSPDLNSRAHARKNRTPILDLWKNQILDMEKKKIQNIKIQTPENTGPQYKTKNIKQVLT